MSLPILNTPTFELTLPSTGLKISYRPFLVKEHKVLLTMAEADEGEVSRIVTELVRACTFNKVNVDQLPHFDIEYIFLQLRAKSIGEIVEVIVNCECGNKIETSYSIDNLQVEKIPGHTNKIMLDDTYGVEMRYPRFSEVVDVFSAGDDTRVIDMIIKNISGVYSNDDYWNAEEQSPEQIEEFVMSLTKEQFDKIEKFFSTAPKVVQVIETDCPKCKKHNISRLEGLANFFV